MCVCYYPPLAESRTVQIHGEWKGVTLAVHPVLCEQKEFIPHFAQCFLLGDSLQVRGTTGWRPLENLGVPGGGLLIAG